MLAAAAAWARPTVEVGNLRPLKAGNVGETFLGEVDGRRWFFKLDGPIGDIQRYGNFEAEVLVGKIFRRLGVLAPQSRVVNVAGRRGAYVQTELVDADFTGGVKPQEYGDWRTRPDRGRLDTFELRLLQLVDVVVGNGDRHDGNLFVAQTDDGQPLVVPIDGNLALSTPAVVKGYYNWHFLDGFHGVHPGAHPDDTGDMLYPRHAPRSGTLERIMRRNGAYEATWNELRTRPQGLADYLRVAEYIARRLDDAFLHRLVTDLADDQITHGDPAARKAEILRLLRFRRDALPAQLREFARRMSPRTRSGLSLMRRSIPPQVWQQLGFSERQLSWVGLHAFSGPRFDPADFYLHLRAAGAPELAAREALQHLCRDLKARFSPRALARTEQSFAGSRFATAVEDFYAEMPAGDYGPPLARSGAERRPLRLVELVAERKGLRYEDARGNPLDRERVAGMKQALKAGMRASQLKPYERMILEFDAFASSGGPDVYDATVRTARGAVRWQGKVSAATAHP